MLSPNRVPKQNIQGLAPGETVEPINGVPQAQDQAPASASPTSPASSPNVQGLAPGETVEPFGPAAAGSASDNSGSTPAPDAVRVNTGVMDDGSDDSIVPPIISRAWKWANQPISYSRPGPLKYLLPKSPAEAAQEADEKAHELHPEDSWIENYIRSAGYGMIADVNRMASPLTAATAAAGAAAPLLGTVGRAAEAVMGTGFAANGAKDVYDSIDRMSNEGVNSDNVKQGLAGLAQVFGGIAGAASGVKGLHSPLTAADQAAQMDHYAAQAVKKHISDVFQAEGKQAGNDIANVDASVDQALPEGAIDGKQIIEESAANRAKLFPAGTKAAPSALGRVEKAVGGIEPDVEEIVNRINQQGLDPSGTLQSIIRSHYDTGGVPDSIIKQLQETGVLPEDTKPWTMKQARQISSDLFSEAKSLKNSSAPGAAKSAAALIDLGVRIRQEMWNAADLAGGDVLDKYEAANARYSQYKNAFGKTSPVYKILNGQNATDIMSPLTGKNSVVVRNLLKPYEQQHGIDFDALDELSNFHKQAKAASTPADFSRLKYAPAMMAFGALIGHPYIGLFGLPMTMGRVGSNIASRLRVAPAFEGLEIGGKSVADSAPAGLISRAATANAARTSLPTRLATGAAEGAGSSLSQAQVPSIFAQAAQAAQAAPGPFGKPTHIDQENGQRIRRHPTTGQWVDVDTGQLLRNLAKLDGGK